LKDYDDEQKLLMNTNYNRPI